MRQDVKALLGRLNRKDLNYHQFADPFADMELWPIFEALLTDERVVAGRQTALGGTDVQVRARSSRAEQAASEASSGKAGLFHRYGTSTPGENHAGEVVNMRQFLASLGDKA